MYSATQLRDMSFLADVISFDATELEEVETVVKHVGYVVDTAPDKEMALVIPGLYISSGDGAANKDEFVKHNIKYVVNLASTVVEDYFPKLATYKSFEALDLPDYDLTNLFNECIKFIAVALSENNDSDKAKNTGCLVHCNAG